MENKPVLRVLHGDGQVAQRGMSRREVVRRLLGGAGMGLALPGVAAVHPVHKHLADAATLVEADTQAAAADWKLQFLDPHMNETLIALAERIVPGSTKAQVNRFIDLLLSVDTTENQQKFINSMSAIEAESIRRYGHPYKELAETQQNELLTVASTGESSQTGTDKDWSWFAVPEQTPSKPARVALRDHFDNLKGWISGTYYSSEIGMRELGWTGQTFFESFPGCQHPGGHH